MRFSIATGLVAFAATAVARKDNAPNPPRAHQLLDRIDFSPRPGYLVDNMDDSPLKNELQQCLKKTKSWKPSTFSVGHRGGATLQMPEHSVHNDIAGARMGAGVLECDTSFTQDRELVCRHSQCDLHFTTNIVTIPELNAKCTTPFTAANGTSKATAKCCTSDITLKEFKSLCALMEGFNATATTPEDFVNAPPEWRTTLYSTCGELFSVQDHIAFVKKYGLLHTAELKTPEVEMPFQGDYTQEKFAQQLVDEYRKAGVAADELYLQSFLYDDILYWLKHEPKYAAQAMFLDSYGETIETLPNAVANLTNYKADGVKYIAPPIPYLIAAKDGKMVPSDYAIKAKQLGFKIVPWTLERSGPLALAAKNADYYYAYFKDAVKKDGDMLVLLDVLYKKVGISAIFSDWADTVTFYANCMNIGLF